MIYAQRWSVVATPHSRIAVGKVKITRRHFANWFGNASAKRQSAHDHGRRRTECRPPSVARWRPASSAHLPGSAPARHGPAHIHRSPPSGPSSPSPSTARRARRRTPPRTPPKEALRRGPGRALGYSTTLVVAAARRNWRCRWRRSGARLQQRCLEPLHTLGSPGLLRLVLFHSVGSSQKRRGN